VTGSWSRRSGWTMPRRRTLASALQASAALGENLASPSWLRSVFYAVARGTVHPSLFRIRGMIGLPQEGDGAC
jgi:hypothetical protein